MSGLIDDGTSSTPNAQTSGDMTSQIAASLAANPHAAGSHGSLFTYGGGNPSAPPMPNFGPGVLTTDDWKNLISGDAGLQSAQAALAGSSAADQNALGAAFTNAYESFGKPVDLATLANQLGMTQADIQNYLGPDAQKIAQENTAAGTSTTSRLDQANQNAIHSIMADLNKRGLLHSGETGYRLDQQNLGYRQAQQDAYGKFLGYLQQYQQGYLAAQQARAGKLADAINSAADRQYNLNQSAPGATNPPPPPPPPADNTPPPTAPPSASPPPPPAANASGANYNAPTVGMTNNADIFRLLGRKMDPRYMG